MHGLVFSLMRENVEQTPRLCYFSVYETATLESYGRQEFDHLKFLLGHAIWQIQSKKKKRSRKKKKKKKKEEEEEEDEDEEKIQAA